MQRRVLAIIWTLGGVYTGQAAPDNARGAAAAAPGDTATALDALHHHVCRGDMVVELIRKLPSHTHTVRRYR